MKQSNGVLIVNLNILPDVSTSGDCLLKKTSVFPTHRIRRDYLSFFQMYINLTFRKLCYIVGTRLISIPMYQHFSEFCPVIIQLSYSWKKAVGKILSRNI